VPHAAQLAHALAQPGHLVCDLPTFLVLPRGSRIAAEFARRNGGRFREVPLPTEDEEAAARAAAAGGR
jgi:hypothetical protein